MSCDSVKKRYKKLNICCSICYVQLVNTKIIHHLQTSQQNFQFIKKYFQKLPIQFTICKPHNKIFNSQKNIFKSYQYNSPSVNLIIKCSSHKRLFLKVTKTNACHIFIFIKQFQTQFEKRKQSLKQKKKLTLYLLFMFMNTKIIHHLQTSLQNVPFIKNAKYWYVTSITNTNACHIIIFNKTILNTI
eukprot:TRINITY_DN2731_c0_g1_i14.p2 TRINITY_DN2731_c0_g1~~TRINITY_DN2731_c0_g1_i14.p2  ORF type:complete len:187 (+),score=-16.93 TRINITY_DN2731_c0_g1_i14:243-803(+)